MMRLILLVTVVMSAGLISVYGETEAVKIGYTIRKQEERRIQLLDRSRALQYSIAHFKAPNNLERRLQAQRIELQAPKEWQTLVLPGGRPERPAWVRPPVNPYPLLGRFLIGTAQAEAKES
ncbi:MAG: hypothetical protein A3D28_04395 [Omnitrophica bacterium RIFCSPHIGHO2_02_FULL_63_14]|nr:MAG: hypothetical protein A3D28_04395 [Omnitrophica bacterium RIFCSPHIGHO2_02_FULL_63_14]